VISGTNRCEEGMSESAASPKALRQEQVWYVRDSKKVSVAGVSQRRGQLAACIESKGRQELDQIALLVQLKAIPKTLRN
jgi:hypothetical protein